MEQERSEARETLSERMGTVPIASILMPCGPGAAWKVLGVPSRSWGMPCTAWGCPMGPGNASHGGGAVGAGGVAGSWTWGGAERGWGQDPWKLQSGR